MRPGRRDAGARASRTTGTPCPSSTRTPRRSGASTPSFGGNKVTGLGFDRDTLTQAGIEDAFAFAAVSDGDNSNILAARVVRETFGIENVVARIYDPHRAEIYQRLGIPTVATVRWTAHQVLRRLLPDGRHRRVPRLLRPDPARRRSTSTQGWVGKPLRALEEASGARIAYVTRYGDGILPTSTTVLQENDTVHVLHAGGRRPPWSNASSPAPPAVTA